MGPNIRPVPVAEPVADTIRTELLLVAGDNVTTDDIAPSNARLLPLRSNIPKLSEHTFGTLSDDFKARAEAAGSGAVVAGENYGQGSSREHAALLPLYLGVSFVLAKSFARIHRSNLINVGILPLLFDDPADAGRLKQGMHLLLKDLHRTLRDEGQITLEIEGTDETIPVRWLGTPAETETLLRGGKLRMAQEANHEEVNYD